MAYKLELRVKRLARIVPVQRADRFDATVVLNCTTLCHNLQKIYVRIGGWMISSIESSMEHESSFGLGLVLERG